MLLLTFLGTLLFFALIIVIYMLDKERDLFILFAAAGMLLMLISIRLGELTTQEREYKYKKKPVVHIECNGKKCDTTYTYKF
jgi:hypothetical protein